MTTAIATAVKEVVKAMPSDPVAAIGRALAGGDAPDRNATAALLSKGLQRRSTVEELHNRGIIKTQIEDKASVLNHARAADVRASTHPPRPHLAPAAPRAIRAGLVIDNHHASLLITHPCCPLVCAGLGEDPRCAPERGGAHRQAHYEVAHPG